MKSKAFPCQPEASLRVTLLILSLRLMAKGLPFAAHTAIREPGLPFSSAPPFFSPSRTAGSPFYVIDSMSSSFSGCGVDAADGVAVGEAAGVVGRDDQRGGEHGEPLYGE